MRALITGAAKRLGRSMAIYLALRGFDLALHYHSSDEDAEDLYSEIKEMGRKCVLLKANLLNEIEVKELVPKANEILGGSLNCLINNASIFEYDTMQSGTRESWDRHMESNLRAPFVLSQQFANQSPDILYNVKNEPTSQALIVNIVDQRVRNLTEDFTSYSIAKMGLWALTQISARGLAPAVRVNAIGPGPTIRNIRQSQEHFENQRAKTILKRGSDPEDICLALGYFVDSPAVTGQLICVDGGQHLSSQTPEIVGFE